MARRQKEYQQQLTPSLEVKHQETKAKEEVDLWQMKIDHQLRKKEQQLKREKRMQVIAEDRLDLLAEEKVQQSEILKAVGETVTNSAIEDLEDNLKKAEKEVDLQ